MQQQQTQNTIQDTIMGLNPLTSDKPMPSNNQIMSSFTRLREVLQRQRLTNPNLDTKGQEIAEAVERFLETSEAFIHEKNPDEAIQKFLQKVSNFIEKSKQEAQTRKAETVGATSTTSSPNLSQVATHLRQLVQQTFTSTQTKSLLRHFDSNMQSMMSIEKRMRNENKSLDEIPREERKELVRSQLKLLAQIGHNKSWASVRQDIMTLYDYFVSKKETVSQPLAHEFSLLVDDAIELFSRFANRNVFKLKQMLVDTYQLLNQDPEARTFLKEFREWGDKVVKNPESADNEDVVRKGEENLDRGLKVYSQHSDRLYALNEEIRELIHALQNEELLTNFKENIKDVGKSLKGSTLSSIIQLRELMGPVIKESLKDFKLPRISDSDNSSNWSVDNIILHESDLDDVILDIRIGLKDVLEVVLKIKKVEIALRDMNFMYERTSLPQFKDQGKMDVKVYTPTWKMRWVVNQQTGREPFFELADVKGKIKDLDITISEAKHTTIDNLLLKMWSSTLKKRVQTSIEETLMKRSAPITTSLNKFLGSAEAVNLSKSNFDSKMKQQTGTGTGSETKQVHEKTY